MNGSRPSSSLGPNTGTTVPDGPKVYARRPKAPSRTNLLIPPNLLLLSFYPSFFSLSFLFLVVAICLSGYIVPLLRVTKIYLETTAESRVYKILLCGLLWFWILHLWNTQGLLGADVIKRGRDLLWIKPLVWPPPPHTSESSKLWDFFFWNFFAKNLHTKQNNWYQSEYPLKSWGFWYQLTSIFI